MNTKQVILLILILHFSIDLKSQPVLLSGKNTPKAEYAYVYKEIVFDYTKAIHAGADTVWDFSDIQILSDTTYSYYTHNSDYNSFLGYDYPSYVTAPDPTDNSYLRSDNVIYRITDSSFYEAYHMSWISTAFSSQHIESGGEFVLKFPFQYNSYMSTGGETYSSWGDGYSWEGSKTADSYEQLSLRIRFFQMYSEL